MPSRLHRFDRLAEFEAKSEEWLEFSRRCPLAAPFCGPGVWLPWLRTCADREPAVFEWRSVGELRALLAMFRRGSTLEMASGPHLDYQDIAALDQESAVAALLALVESESAQSTTLVFPKVAEGSRLARALADRRVAEFVRVESRYWSRCPVATIPRVAGVDFSSSLAARQRKDYRNATRRLAETFPKLVAEHHGPGRFDPARIDEAAAVHRANQYRKKGDSVCADAAYLAFLKALAESDAPLCLSLLRDQPGGAPLAFHLGYFADDCFYYYLTAYAGEHAKLSPGRWLLVDALRHWHGRVAGEALRFDMLCGEEEYKSRWPATPYLVSRVVLIPRRLANLPRILAYATVYGLKNARNRRLPGRPACGLVREPGGEDLVLPG